MKLVLARVKPEGESTDIAAGYRYLGVHRHLHPLELANSSARSRACTGDLLPPVRGPLTYVSKYLATTGGGVQVDKLADLAEEQLS
jgi:hypothetical protein